MEGWPEKLPPGPGFLLSSPNLLRAALRREQLDLVSETVGSQSGYEGKPIPQGNREKEGVS